MRMEESGGKRERRIGAVAVSWRVPAAIEEALVPPIATADERLVYRCCGPF